MTRESFLDRVRQAAQLGQAHRVHLHPVPPEVGYVGADGDLCEKFAAEVDAVGGTAHLVPNLSAARGTLEKILDEIGLGSLDSQSGSERLAGLSTRGASGPHGALCWQHELLTRLGLEELLRSRGIERLDYVSLAAMHPEQRRQAMLGCAIGITSCDCAIAETGSLLVCSRSGRERVASLLPPVHIAVVERAQMVPDLIDAIELLRGKVERNSFRSVPGSETQKGNGMNSVLLSGKGMNPVLLPSNAVLITGPSKTGDIELQLTTGVHGPGTWHVIVIRE